MTGGIPETVFLTLGIPRSRAREFGMSGCGLQLDPSGEYAWREATITLDTSLEEVQVFLRVNDIPFTIIPNIRNTARITFPQMQLFISKIAGIREFLESFRRNKFLRLGRKSYSSPWELNSRDAFLLGMSDEEFSRYYITDPRGRLLSSEVSSRTCLHSPVLRAEEPLGLPDPVAGGWI